MQRFLQLVPYILAAAIIAGTLLYTNSVVGKLAEQERKRVELYANAQAFLGSVEDDCEADFVFNNIIRENTLIPTILTDSNGVILFHLNLTADDSANLKLPLPVLDKMVQEEFEEIRKQNNNPIVLHFGEGNVNYVYFGESGLIRKLRWFPYLQLLIIVAFIAVLFAGFFAAKRAEQNRLWVGMARETAHQLGTPVSSLMAWTELLHAQAEENPDLRETTTELRKDVERLEIITERFSKIGMVPDPVPMDLDMLIGRVCDYMRRRMPASGRVTLHTEIRLEEDSKAMVVPSLLEWVFENLIRNALDAILSTEDGSTGSGQISITATETHDAFIIDVSDTGKGIPGRNFRKIFSPGFTTKKRGWGLGLSLSRRIVESFHRGRIYVKESEPFRRTTIRIELPKKP